MNTTEAMKQSQEALKEYLETYGMTLPVENNHETLLIIIASFWAGHAAGIMAAQNLWKDQDDSGFERIQATEELDKHALTKYADTLQPK